MPTSRIRLTSVNNPEFVVPRKESLYNDDPIVENLNDVVYPHLDKRSFWQKLEEKIYLDLKRHFGSEVTIERLFLCLGISSKIEFMKNAIIPHRL